MKYIIHGNNLEVTEPIKSYVEEKLNKLDKFLHDSEVEAKVVIKTRPREQKIEVTIPLKNGLLRSEVTTDDLYKSIDLVVEKIEGQLRKVKTKLLKTKKGMKTDVFVMDNIKDIEDTESIIRTKDIIATSMDDEMAIIELNLLDLKFFVYKDIESLQTKILYKRDDLNYGIIKIND